MEMAVSIGFFRDWVYGTDIPKYHLAYSLSPADQGKVLLTGKITQSGVSDGFEMSVPVYVDFIGTPQRIGLAPVHGNGTSNEFKVLLPRKPKRVLLNANHDILSSENTVSEGAP